MQADSLWFRIFKSKYSTIVLLALTLLVLALSIPGSLRDDLRRGEIYVFSRDFLEDIPKRLTGPGRFRFVMQPLMAIILGILNGRADAHAERPPYLYAVLFHPNLRTELMKSAFQTVINLVLMGILLDVIFQRIILGVAYPGAALVVGPALIILPYTLARALSNRVARRTRA